MIIVIDWSIEGLMLLTPVKLLTLFGEMSKLTD